jgi:chitinase
MIFNYPKFFMRSIKPSSLLSLALLFVAAALIGSCRSEQDLSGAENKKVIIGYVPGFRGELGDLKIDAKKLTHINYAFVDVKDSMAWLTNIGTDTINFRKLNYLKKENPDLKILISIGGWGWSENFSDAVLTANARKKFAQTSVAIIEQNKLDGVDIDWEYPGFKGEDNVFRPEDRENFTLMFEALRKELDNLTAKTGKRYLLTTAVPDFTEFLNKTDMDKAAEYMDYVNLMTYDFNVSAGDTVGHHSNLYHSANYKGRSADRGIKEYIAKGVPAHKLVMGIPFYGRSWFMKNADNRGINRVADSVARAGGYTFIKDSLVTKPGFVRYWDEDAKAPYLFNAAKNQLVVYDDEESVKIKCDYVKENKLAGMMFWQYASDPKEYLLTTINEEFQ